MGLDLDEPGFDVPPGADQLGCREGPIFLAVPWAGLGAALLATAAASAGLYVAERTGVGQHVETSLAQAAINMNAMGWQRVARMHPSYRLWYFDRRAPKGIFQAGDGRWLHQWAPFHHQFLRAHAAGADPALADQPLVIAGGDYETSVRAQAEAFVETAAAVATRPCAEWVALAAEAKIGLQPILSPEEALLDEPLAAEGVIVELDDPEHGPIRQVGHVYAFDAVPSPPIEPRPAQPTAVADVTGSWPARPAGGHGTCAGGAAGRGRRARLRAGHRRTVRCPDPRRPRRRGDQGDDAGVRPHGRDLRRVEPRQGGTRRRPQAPPGQEIARRLIERADVVHHNMRTGVAERLGIGWEQARAINPRLVYCHTRGFERDGPRTPLPGNDQMGHALAGTAYEAGGTHHGTPPIWQMTAYGDTGNGILSASAVIQALRHRDRTGEGQFVHTSILNACMLFNSSTFIDRDGRGPARDRIDAQQYGFDGRAPPVRDRRRMAVRVRHGRRGVGCGRSSDAASASASPADADGPTTQLAADCSPRTTPSTGASCSTGAACRARSPRPPTPASCSTTPTCTTGVGWRAASTPTSARSSTSPCRSPSPSRRARTWPARRSRASTAGGSSGSSATRGRDRRARRRRGRAGTVGHNGESIVGGT